MDCGGACPYIGVMNDVPPKHSVTAPKPWLEVFALAGGTWAVVLSVICVVATVFSVNGYHRSGIYERVGLEAQAVITDKRTSRTNDTTKHFLTFEFEGGGQFVQRERSVSRSVYRSSPIGSQRAIRYLPENPRQFESYIGQSRDTARGSQMMAGVFGIGGLVTLWWVGGRTNRAVLSRKYGYRATARVTKIKERRNKYGRVKRKILHWRTDDGLAGKSFARYLEDVDHIGLGDQINVYAHEGRTVWESDVGPAKIDRSKVPMVPR